MGCLARELIERHDGDASFYAYNGRCEECATVVDFSLQVPESDLPSGKAVYDPLESNRCPGAACHAVISESSDKLYLANAITSGGLNAEMLYFGEGQATSQAKRETYRAEPDQDDNQVAKLNSNVQGGQSDVLQPVDCLLGADYNPKPDRMSHIVLNKPDGSKQIVTDATDYLQYWDRDGTRYPVEGPIGVCALSTAIRKGVELNNFFKCGNCAAHNGRPGLFSIGPFSQGVSKDHVVDLGAVNTSSDQTPINQPVKQVPDGIVVVKGLINREDYPILSSTGDGVAVITVEDGKTYRIPMQDEDMAGVHTPPTCIAFAGASNQQRRGQRQDAFDIVEAKATAPDETEAIALVGINSVKCTDGDCKKSPTCSLLAATLANRDRKGRILKQLSLNNVIFAES